MPSTAQTTRTEKQAIRTGIFSKFKFIVKQYVNNYSTPLCKTENKYLPTHKPVTGEIEGLGAPKKY